ncbi:MAG: 50S ribosomal protein L17 [Patescibacteria group bacterium]
MRHLKKGRKFGRERKLRRALYKNMAADFFMRGRIATTEAKAKELRPYMEQVLTRAKSPTLANRRMLAASVSPAAAAHATRHASTSAARPGGYTRIIKQGSRRSDGARMAILELVR